MRVFGLNLKKEQNEKAEAIASASHFMAPLKIMLALSSLDLLTKDPRD